MNIFVGNLPYSASEEDVRTLFSQYGRVHAVRLILDRETSRPRGFGFVKMGRRHATMAIEALNGYDFGGRPLRVNEAVERRSSPRIGGAPMQAEVP